MPEVEAVSAYGQRSLGRVERLGLRVVDETRAAPRKLLQVENLGECLARVRYGLAVSAAKDLAVLCYLEGGVSSGYKNSSSRRSSAVCPSCPTCSR